MNRFHDKYLKYKQKYLDLKEKSNMVGGALEGKYETEYMNQLTLFYTTKYKNNDNFFSDILKYFLNMLWTGAINTLDKHISNSSGHLKTQINELKIKLYELIKFCVDKYGEDKFLDISEFNVFSLQVVILFTKLTELLINNSEITNMKNYVIKTIRSIYNDFKNSWNSYDDLYKKIEASEFKGILGTIKTFMNDKYEVQQKLTKIHSYKNKDITKKTCLVCYIGIISLEDLVKMYSYNFYPLGVTESMDWADGMYLTPFEFLHHDIGHYQNRGVLDGDQAQFEREQRFILYLDELKKINASLVDNLYIILFLIIHESQAESLLSNDQINYKFNSLIPKFIVDTKNWMNENFYGSLLPNNIDKQSDEIIQDYLNTLWNQFVTIWNSYHIIIKK